MLYVFPFFAYLVYYLFLLLEYKDHSMHKLKESVYYTWEGGCLHDILHQSYLSILLYEGNYNLICRRGGIYTNNFQVPNFKENISSPDRCKYKSIRSRSFQLEIVGIIRRKNTDFSCKEKKIYIYLG